MHHSDHARLLPLEQNSGCTADFCHSDECLVSQLTARSIVTMIAGAIKAHVIDSITIGAMRPYTAQACNRSLCHEATLQHPLGHPMSALMHGQHEGFGK